MSTFIHNIDRKSNFFKPFFHLMYVFLYEGDFVGMLSAYDVMLYMVQFVNTMERTIVA